MDWSIEYPYLWELSSGKLDFIKVILTTFLQTSEDYKKELTLSMNGTDKEISMVAHKLKSAAKIVGATDLSKEFEYLQDNPNKEALPLIIDKLDTFILKVKRDIEIL